MKLTLISRFFLVFCLILCFYNNPIPVIIDNSNLFLRNLSKNSSPFLCPIKSLKGVNKNLPSPFSTIERDTELTYTPIVLLPNLEWYKENNLSTESTEYSPQIVINGKTLLYRNESSNLDYKKFGFHWTPVQSSLNTIEFQIWYTNNTLFKSDSIIVRLVLPKPPKFSIRDTELHFGIINRSYQYTTYEMSYILYPDGFLMKHQYESNQDKVIPQTAWIEPEKYTWAINMLIENDFFFFKNNYFDPAESSSNRSNYISLRIWNPDGTFNQIIKFHSGLAVPISVKSLWNSLYEFLLEYDTSLMLRTESVNNIGFLSSCLTISLLILRKKNRK